jgi:hypothetical protein
MAFYTRKVQQPLSGMQFAATISVPLNDYNIIKPMLHEADPGISGKKQQELFGNPATRREIPVQKRKSRTEVRKALNLDTVSSIVESPYKSPVPGESFFKNEPFDKHQSFPSAAESTSVSQQDAKALERSFTQDSQDASLIDTNDHRSVVPSSAHVSINSDLLFDSSSLPPPPPYDVTPPPHPSNTTSPPEKRTPPPPVPGGTDDWFDTKFSKKPEKNNNNKIESDAFDAFSSINMTTANEQGPKPELFLEFQETVLCTEKNGQINKLEVNGKINYGLEDSSYALSFPITVDFDCKTSGSTPQSSVIKDYQSNDFTFIRNKLSDDKYHLQFQIESLPRPVSTSSVMSAISPPQSSKSENNMSFFSSSKQQPQDKQPTLPIITYQFADTFKPAVMKAKYKLQANPVNPAAPLSLLIQIAMNHQFPYHLKNFKVQISLSGLFQKIHFDSITLDSSQSSTFITSSQYDNKKYIFTTVLDSFRVNSTPGPTNFITILMNILNFNQTEYDTHSQELLSGGGVAFPMIIKGTYEDTLFSTLSVEKTATKPNVDKISVKKQTSIEFRFH